jgi:hypothetical protein
MIQNSCESRDLRVSSWRISCRISTMSFANLKAAREAKKSYVTATTLQNSQASSAVPSEVVDQPADKTPSSENLYKPIPDCLEIRTSPTSGRGLWTKLSYSPGELSSPCTRKRLRDHPRAGYLRGEATRCGTLERGPKFLLLAMFCPGYWFEAMQGVPGSLLLRFCACTHNCCRVHTKARSDVSEN